MEWWKDCEWIHETGATNIAGWKMDPLIESMYFLLKMGIFQPAMLVYTEGIFFCCCCCCRLLNEFFFLSWRG